MIDNILPLSNPISTTYRVFIFFWLAITLSQCKSTQYTSKPITLENTKWILSEMNGTPLIPLENTRVANFILKTDGGTKTISGYAGCNSIAGSFVHSGEQISFKVISTKMMCPDPQMEVEDFFLKALTSADSFQIEGDILQLFAGNTSLAVFRYTPGP